ncbi:glutaredoxin-like protein NrdH [Mixta gaviniae]|uniref:Glutaredoxin-like protein NrdH n=1 Tax=Mixta gaviniae TaxID=665914 RepID=A0A1X1DJI2_9GAMM|nr:glutaredoxin-like protein NrdH [Mixta gaviniae]AUX94500.1 NrdH-redoxin [Mixta gaviniae]ORM76842.1 NrdH-redoxin [Mixta gaviniae]
MIITIFTKHHCMQCDATKNMMDKQGLCYRLVNLDEEPEAAAQVMALGYRQAPVVMTDSEHWSGFRPDHIMRLAQLTLAQE